MEFQMKNTVFGSGRPKICVPLTGGSTDSVVHQAGMAADSQCEVVEWRVDLFNQVVDTEVVVETLSHLKTILRDKLLLVTFRTEKEGGKPQEFSLKQYRELYTKIAETGLVDLLDIELEVAEYLGRSFIQQFKEQKIGVILSHHNFSKTPADGELVLKISIMKQFDADMGKLAVMPNSLKDVLRLMNVSAKLKGLVELPLILISMGDLGKTSRVSGELIESVMTFGSLAEASAPGQIPVNKLVEILDLMQIDTTMKERDKDV